VTPMIVPQAGDRGRLRLPPMAIAAELVRPGRRAGSHLDPSAAPGAIIMGLDVRPHGAETRLGEHPTQGRRHLTPA
jgi:hypothetical protein